MTNIETVQQVYAAFGRGDIPGILRHLAPDVDWECVGEHTDVPWLAPRRGRADVSHFFEAAQLIEIHRFEPKTYVATGNLVLVLVDEEFSVKDTGRRVREVDQVHLWYFDAQGAIVRHRARLDTYAQWAAYHDR